MAGQNSFRKLKDHAEKACKFKQHVYYNAIYTISQTQKTVVIGQPVFEKTKNGFCTALSVDWLGEQLRGASASRYPRMQGKDLAKDEKGLGHSADMMRLQHKVYTEHDGKPFMQRLMVYVAAHELQSPISGSGLEGSLAEHMDELLYRPDHHGYVVLQDLKVNGNVRGHCVAISHQGDQIRFFDPNIGGYMIEKGKAEKFCEVYMDLVKQNFGFEIYCQTRYVVLDPSKEKKVELD